MTAPPPLDHLYTIDEVAAALRISKNNAYTKQDKDQWPNHRIGIKLLYTAADFEAIKQIYAQTPTPQPAKRTRRTRR